MMTPEQIELMNQVKAQTDRLALSLCFWFLVFAPAVGLAAATLRQLWIRLARRTSQQR